MGENFWKISFIGFLLVAFTPKLTLGKSNNRVHRLRQTHLELINELDVLDNELDVLDINAYELEANTSILVVPFTTLEEFIAEWSEDCGIENSYFEVNCRQRLSFLLANYIFSQPYATRARLLRSYSGDRGFMLDVDILTLQTEYIDLIEQRGWLTIEVSEDGISWQSFNLQSDKVYPFDCQHYKKIRVSTTGNPTPVAYDLECQKRYVVYWNQNHYRWDIATITE